MPTGAVFPSFVGAVFPSFVGAVFPTPNPNHNLLGEVVELYGRRSHESEPLKRGRPSRPG